MLSQIGFDEGIAIAEQSSDSEEGTLRKCALAFFYLTGEDLNSHRVFRLVFFAHRRDVTDDGICLFLIQKHAVRILQYFFDRIYF